jgi:transposase
MLDTTTGEVVEVTLKHEGDNVREFYSSLPRPVRVGIEATGSMQWFLNLMEELGIECLVGHPAQIRAAAPRKQKNDRRDAELILKMLVEGRFPAIWLPSKELLDLRSLLRHRHQWVRLRTRIQNALQSIALANGLRRGTALWSHDGQNRIASLSLAPHTAYRRSELQAMYEKFEAEIEKLNQRVEEQASKRPGARTLRYIWNEQRGLCTVCKLLITRTTGWRLHHCVPLVRGGSKSAENRVLLHPECHDTVHRQNLSVSKPRLPERGVRRA